MSNPRIRLTLPIALCIASGLHAENGKIKLLREALDTLAASKAFSKD